MPGTARPLTPPLLRDLLSGRDGLAQDDEALLARFVRDRDEAAFAALVVRHGPLVLSTARAVLRHEHDAEDAFQATFLALARRAPAIRSGATLAAWLHRTAHRAAVRLGRAARRRQQVEITAATARAIRPAPLDPAAAVHAALDRLPRPYRLAVVLCDLDGQTYAEAAARLGCTEAALRNRLARARARLRATLGRDDLAALALPRLDIPQPLLRATTSLAVGRGASSPAVLALARRGAAIGWIRLHPVIPSTLAIMAVAAGSVLIIGGDPPGDRAIPSDPTPPRALAPVAPRPVDPSAARGRVVDPAGRPVAGAEVALRSLDPREDAWPTARSGADGRYELIPAAGWRGPAVTQYRALLTATAPGFAAGWADFDAGPGDTEIRLVAEGPTLEGRVLDEAGRPVGGARVVARSIHVARPRVGEGPAAAFDRLLAGPRGVANLGPFEQVPVTIRAATAGNGRFTIRGIGAERIATLEVSGPTLATTEVEVMTRGGAGRQIQVGGGFHGEERTLHPNGFEWTVPPTRIIAGTVRDAASGTPLVGWRVAGTYQRGDTLGAGETTCPTDSAGRYRLVGLPAASWYEVTMTPPPGEPYLDGYFRLDAPGEGAAPVACDAALRQGVVVRGRVTDRASGAPVSGRISVRPYPGDPPDADHPEFDPNRGVSTRADADGRYELVTPAGRTLLAFRADRRELYRFGQGAEELPGYDPARLQIRSGLGGSIIQTWYDDVFVVLDVLPSSRSARFDVQVVPESGVELAILDQDGRPLDAGAGDIAVHSPRHSVIREGTRLILRGSRPGESRRVLVWHRGRKLAGAVDAVADGPPQSVRLAPWGELRGRIVGEGGAPRGDLPLVLGPCADAGARPEPVGVRNDLPGLDAYPTDPAGRYRIEGLVPGISYGLLTWERGRSHAGDLVADLTLAPGEIRDLGEIIVRPGELSRPRPRPRP